MPREATNKIIDMVKDGILDPRDVLTACLKYMSEADVADMAETNCFFEGEEVDDG